MLSERKLSAHTLAALLWISFAVGTINAQVTATVSGRVEDSSGAAVPGASVTVTSLETGAGRTATTNETGTYRVLSLPVGRYEVRGELPGFKAALQTGVNLAVGEEAVVNLKLEVGAPQELVTVTGEAPLVNAISPEQRINLETLEVRDLPMVNRNITNILSVGTGLILILAAQSMRVGSFTPPCTAHSISAREFTVLFL